MQKKSSGKGAHPKTQTLIEYTRSMRKNINVEGKKRQGLQLVQARSMLEERD
jgi:hypothetical protein